MGLKTLKWIYDLGVKHERDRIAHELREEATALRLNNQELYKTLDGREGKPSHKKALMEVAVNDRLQFIIAKIFDTQYITIENGSIIHPKKGKKK